VKDLGQIYGLSTDLTEVKLNFGLSPDFSVQLKVSLKAKSKVKVTHCRPCA